LYHRLGFDKFSDNIVDARAAITDALPNLRRVYEDKPNSFLMKAFFDAKADEIVNLFSQATSDEKNRAIQLLTIVDPANSIKYQNMAGGK
jgi:DNA-binding MurR/RpiR family transcriptional regulator